jgi:hypothetical protein
MDIEATTNQAEATACEQAMEEILAAGAMLYDAAIEVSEEHWVAVKEEARQRVEFFQYMVRVRRRVYGVTIEWMKGRSAGSGENRRMLFSTITRGRTMSYPRSRFGSANEWELARIMAAEKEFGKIRMASDLAASAGRRLAWVQKTLERTGEVEERRIREVLREVSKACAVANSFKGGDLEI